MQRKERIQSQKNGDGKIEQKNRVGKTTIDIFNTREQYLLATNGTTILAYNKEQYNNNKEQYQLTLDQKKNIEAGELKK